MGAPLSLFTGVWFSLFGGAVIWWCVVEVRLRRTLRRVGVSGMARVVPAAELESVRVAVGATVSADGAAAAEPDRAVEAAETAGAAETAEGAGDSEAVEVDHADNAPMLCFEAEGHGEVITRPRGWTSIRRSSSLTVGALVPIAYDPEQPTRVALQGVPQSRSDLFWLLLGLAFVACGVTLLATAL